MMFGMVLGVLFAISAFVFFIFIMKEFAEWRWEREKRKRKRRCPRCKEQKKHESAVRTNSEYSTKELCDDCKEEQTEDEDEDEDEDDGIVQINNRKTTIIINGKKIKG